VTSPFAVGAVVAERYEVLDVIGRGATGTVYRARDLYVDATHEIVALKVVHQNLLGDRQIFGRFRREAQILRRLEGPHVCRLLELIEKDGLLAIAIEHVRGPSLEVYLRRYAPLPVREAVAIAIQICRALAAAHESDVIHRDLKPSNVLIEGLDERLALEIARKSGEREALPPASFLGDLAVRVVDFGLAKVLQGDGDGTALTERDMIFGTPDYMSPEQVRGDDLDHRCDLYAVGALLYEMLSGRVPFDTPGPLTTMAAHLHQPVPPLGTTSQSASVPVWVERVVMRALAKDRAERYASAQHLMAALRAGDGAADALAVTATSEADSRPAAAPTPEESPVIQVKDDDATAEDALGTTMQSPRLGLVDAPPKRGARVQIVVDAVAEQAGGASVPPSGLEERPPSSPARPSSGKGTASSDRRGTPSRTAVLSEGGVERRLWTIVAIAAAVAALVIGVVLGAR
jgi:serine/threonine-protein kinase